MVSSLRFKNTILEMFILLTILILPITYITIQTYENQLFTQNPTTSSVLPLREFSNTDNYNFVDGISNLENNKKPNFDLSASDIFPEGSFTVNRQFTYYRISTDSTFALVDQVISFYVSSTNTVDDTGILLGTNTTNGVDEISPIGIHDNPATIDQAGWASLTATLPTLETLESAGINPGDTAYIISYYPSGNVSSNIAGLPAFGYYDSFTLNAFVNIGSTVPNNPFDGTNNLRQGDSADFTITTDIAGSTPIQDAELVDLELYYTNGTEITDFNSLGFSFDISNNNLSDANGEIDVTIHTHFAYTPIEEYVLNYTIDFDGTGYTTGTLNNTKENSVLFQVTPAAYVIDSDPINLKSGNSTARIGESLNFSLFAVARSSSVGGLPVDITLTYEDGTPIPDPSVIGITFKNSSGSTQLETDPFGDIVIIINTSIALTPAATYNLTYSLDYSPPYSGEEGSIVKGSFLFRIVDAKDVGVISFIQATPTPPVDPPELHPRSSPLQTNITYQVVFTDAFDESTYTVPNIPVMLSMSEYSAGTTAFINNGFSNNGSTQWALTNSTGFVEFYVNTSFPLQFLDTTITINATAAFDAIVAPIYDVLDVPTNYHYFMKSNEGTSTDISEIRTISVDSEFSVCTLDFTGTNTTSDEIRPGEDMEIVFMVLDQQLNPVSGVPVNVSLTSSIPGLSLTGYAAFNPIYNLTHHYSSAAGNITVFLSSTYLVTPEVRTAITFAIKADFLFDGSETNIGEYHSDTDTWANYENSWSTLSLPNSIFIDPNFDEATISLLSVNDSDQVIRPGDNITLTYIVRNSTSSPLKDIPVKIELNEDYAGLGIQISIFNLVNNPATVGLPGYYNTSDSGTIIILLETSLTLTPYDQDIYLKGVADFTAISHDGTPYSKWLVGTEPSTSNFRSAMSYSNLTAISHISVDPQYLYAEIIIQGIPNNPTVSRVQQTESLSVTFEVSPLAGTISSGWDNVKVTLYINDTDGSDNFMQIVGGQEKYTNDNLVKYTIDTNVSGATPEGIYNIVAQVDYLNDESTIYNITHPTVPSGELLGVWLRGTDHNEYDNTSFVLTVKNQDTLRVNVKSVNDLSHTDEGLSNGFWEVYRGTTRIYLNGTYKDISLDPVQGRTLEIRFRYTTGGDTSTNHTITGATATTDSSGNFEVDFLLDASLIINDLEIFAEDTSTAEEAQVSVSNIRLVSQIDITDMQLFRSGSNLLGTNYVHAGESFRVNGTTRDEFGNIVTDSELDNHIVFSGWNGSTIWGDFINTSVGSYNEFYEIPANYASTIFYIRVNITDDGSVTHYRTTYNEKLINIYQNIGFNLSVWIEGAYNDSYITNTTINVENIGLQLIRIDLVLFDNLTKNPLADKTVIITWKDDSPIIITVDQNGEYSGNYYLNEGDDYSNISMYTVVHQTDNGTALTPSTSLSFDWFYHFRLEIDSSNTYENFGTLLDNTTIYIKGEVNDSVTNYVTAIDISTGLPLDNQNINIQWGTLLPQVDPTDGSGETSSEIYLLTVDGGFQNLTIDFSAYLEINNLQVLELYTITYDWTVYDITSPDIVILTNDFTINQTILSNSSTVTIRIQVEDPSDTHASNGLDKTTVNIIIDSSPYLMIDIGLNVFEYTWDTDNLLDKFYEIYFTAEDNVGNSNTTEIVLIGMDKIKPKITQIEIRRNNDYLEINTTGYAIITGIITSSHNMDLGIDITDLNSVVLTLINYDTQAIVSSFNSSNEELTFIQLSSTTYNFTFIWQLVNNTYDSDNIEKISPFTETENWRINVQTTDRAGNIKNNETDVKIDNSAPIISADFNVNPNIFQITSINGDIDNIITVSFTAEDNKTYINDDYTIIKIANQLGAELSHTTIEKTENGYEITYSTQFTITESTNGDYTMSVIIFDHSGNKLSIVSSPINIYHSSQTTEPITTDPNNSSGLPSGGGFQLIPFVIFNIVAFSLGIGVAVLYEKLKWAKR